MNIAYFISSHGFGHATRASAIMEELRLKDQSIHLDIFSGTPEWLFTDSHVTAFTYHPGAVDVGLVQKSAMEHDLPATVTTVNEYLNCIPERSEQLAEELKALQTEAVICDISPLGIITGKKAGLPVFLFENFTWDWIYALYEDREPGFISINARLRDIFAQADYRMQSEPLCDPTKRRDAYIPPVSRRPHTAPEELRRILDIPAEHQLGMISMGGIPENLDTAAGSAVPENVTLLLPGTFKKIERRGNKILLPHHSGIYHPDMVNAADFLIGKAGYSTIAEVCASGAAYGYIRRENFRESDVTAAFLRRRKNTLEIDKKRFERFTLDEEISKLSSLGKRDALPLNGRELAADFILQKLRAA